jgi:hypothetical protein
MTWRARFRPAPARCSAKDTQATLVGQLIGGTLIRGRDFIRIARLQLTCGSPAPASARKPE